jgi:hypothetical protein
LLLELIFGDVRWKYNDQFVLNKYKGKVSKSAALTQLRSNWAGFFDTSGLE